MKELKGTKTEKNLQEASQVSHKHTRSINIGLLKQRKTATSR